MPPPSHRFDVIVIGGGAAGMMAAATAGQRGRRVLIVEHYKVIGEKIRISGGGRCNFTNVGASARNYLSQNPDFCRSALARYTPQDFIALVERHAIAYHEKTLGQLFCDGSAQAIIAMLLDECAQGGVTWWQPCPVDGVVREGGAWAIDTPRGRAVADAVVVATGGLSVPKIGATPFAYRLAEQLGVAVVPPRPALVPLALPPDTLARFAELSGVSLEVVATCGAGRFREQALLTHRGLSGPAILQVSSYWHGGEPVVLDLLPDVDAVAWLTGARRSAVRLDTLLAERLPKRFAQQWAVMQRADRPLHEIAEARLRELGAALHAWSLAPSGTLGWNKAEVTLGGVDTRALSSQTLAVRDAPGLHFIGEAVDVTGWLGGYNFQWAWASGRAAGQVC
jgi:predicted Rossmann fold flavoprotein